MSPAYTVATVMYRTSDTFTFQACHNNSYTIGNSYFGRHHKFCNWRPTI